MKTPNPICTDRQYRAARALLGWTRAELALAAGVPERAIDWLEHDNSRGAEYSPVVLETLEANGVVFLRTQQAPSGELVAVGMFDTPPPIKPAVRLVIS